MGVDGDTDATVALLFNTLIIRRKMMERTWIRAGGGVDGRWGGFVGGVEAEGGVMSCEEGDSTVTWDKYNS